jgi:hypothetical protein
MYLSLVDSEGATVLCYWILCPAVIKLKSPSCLEQESSQCRIGWQPIHAVANYCIAKFNDRHTIGFLISASRDIQSIIWKIWSRTLTRWRSVPLSSHLFCLPDADK